MPNTLAIEINEATQTRADKVDEYVNQRTQTGSPEQALHALVRAAVSLGVDYLNHGTEQTSFSGEHNDEAYGKALGMAQAAEVATRGEITEDDIIAAVQVAYTQH